jgi:uncharacterized protein YbaR (Trm112 family)
MKETHNCLHTQKKISKEVLDNCEDFCPVCEKSLFYSEELSQRIGLVDSNNRVIGWICPFCDTEFGINDEIVYIYGKNTLRGRT